MAVNRHSKLTPYRRPKLTPLPERFVLRERGTSILLVEQLIEKALALADRVYALARGKIVLEATTTERDLARRLEQAYFGHETTGVWAGTAFEPPPM